MTQVELSSAMEQLRERFDALFIPTDGALLPTLDGETPLVATPVDTESLAQLMAEGNRLGLKVAARGSGSKMDRGNHATRIDLVVDMRHFNRVVEHAAGDLVVTAQAGVLLSDLQAELSRAGQFLALDPPVPGTVGGLVATADSGPRRLRYGGVRDQILGVTFVRPDGVVARGGGKVVKNVAGYDLPKLLTGALGTLGIVTEAVFRLYSIPLASVTLRVSGVGALDAGRFAARLLDSTLVPTVIDFVSFDGEGQIAARFEAPLRSAQEQAERARSIIGRPDAEFLDGTGEAELWSHFDGVSTAPLLARLISPTTDLGLLLDTAKREADAAGATLTARAHMGHGHALVAWAGADDNACVRLILSLRRQAEARNGNLVLWRGSNGVRNAVEVWGNPGEGIGIMRRIKSEFDPNNTLNPGRFVGGI